MAITVLLLSDTSEDAGELLPAWPPAPYRVLARGLKETLPADLIPIHPDLLLVDATADAAVAEEATRLLSLAWEVGLPPILVVVDESGIDRFRFESGADDFVVTTASQAEIAARLALLTRRAGHGDEPSVLKVGDLTVNPENYQVYVRGRPLDLTYKEFELLKFLAQRPGRVCDRDLLLREVWGFDYYGGTRTVDVHVRRLRAKLGAEHEALIETIRNVGYRLVPRPRERRS
ncbi:MAG TPA: response regulator transcription factor [Actinomycetota bacterium]|nr:response regulator transcription factor [Actinomycetota bacterium]